MVLVVNGTLMTQKEMINADNGLLLL